MSHARTGRLGAGGRLRLAAIVGAVTLVGGLALPLVGPVAAATGYSGQFGPVVINGELDLNGDNAVDATDDSGAFFGDTAIIDGRIDCDAWTGANDGAAGDGSITADDDCTLVAYDGSITGQVIDVSDGLVPLADGQMPGVFPQSGDFDNPSATDAAFAWTAINGKVDTNGNGYINANDCAFFLVGSVNILANTKANTNPCGFGSPHPSWADNGKVDLNGSNTITAADSCVACFFGHGVDNGLVQAFGATTDYADYTGFLSPTIINGAADVNGDAVVDTADDANAFFGDASIIDGYLDCDSWSSKNDGSAGDGVIDANDDCKLLGYDGTVSGLLIEVVDGEFQVDDGPMPYFYPDPSTPNNPWTSHFAWHVIGGRVDSNGDWSIDEDDCSFDLSNNNDVLASDGTNPCGFAADPSFMFNGLVDLNDDMTITSDDTCDVCFFGHDVLNGAVLNPGLSIDDVTMAEGNSGTTAFTFTVTLEGNTPDTVDVHWSTANGTGSAPGDYATASGDLTFLSGETTKTVTVLVVGDTVNEADQTFLVSLSNPINGFLEDGSGLGTISNDDAVPTLAISDVAHNEGNSGITTYTFTVTKTGATEQTVMVHYATADSTAIQPADYASASGDLTFLAGDTTKTFSVDVVGDTAVEANEAFFVNLSVPVIATISDAQGVGTITNDDTVVPPATCPGYAADPRNQIVGTAGIDFLTGTAGDDIICGLGSADTINGAGGDDLLLGGPGADTIHGNTGDDALYGNKGNDKLYGDEDNDDFFGGAGNDGCRQGPGSGTGTSCEYHLP
jgi:hypothetical protein